ncbi:monovalent cation:proton antiporter family protein [Neptunomonas antarctica]|uniref:Kef-type potassium/proton antiporter, CPA2 family n=1 Tax=Neptunomonas antarctica TaxID=619304 RepID=A0A1N7M1L8_9GAMM|nr:monovalent cation:proton antiporter family protein [Neptunomonas antarctica]SIS79985.1 Kef-type potassium/proton antiporter, CPA2 family [Neptunomonas antarctica]
MMDQSFFEQFLIILLSAVIAITCLRYLHLPPILAYLSVGIIVGPFSLNLVEYSDTIHLLSELGVVFLLFMLGLEFSLPRMITMRKTVFGLGFLQVLSTSLLILFIAISLGIPLATAIVISGALALSSTAIVTRELIQASELNTGHGQISIGILLFQDLAAVFFLIIVPSLSGQQDIDGEAIIVMLLEGATLLLILLLLGRTLLPTLFHEVAKAHSDELFVMTALVAALTAAWLTHTAGLSMALGGFLAGMMLGESRYKHQLEADIRPFRDLLLGLFFVSVGMQLNLMALQDNWYWVILITISLLTLKTLTTTGLAFILHKDLKNAFRAGMCLSQGGEFGFALLTLAMSYQLVSSQLNAVITSTIIFSMICTPLLITLGRKLSPYLSADQPVPTYHPFTSTHTLQLETSELNNHVVICGYGRVGQIITRFLKPLKIPYVIMDSDPLRVQESAAAGECIYYGDAKRHDLMKSIGAERAKLIIITFPDEEEAIKTLNSLRHHLSRVPILVRTRDDSLLEVLQQAGATEVIPEKLEGSLMLVSHVLTMLKIPAWEIRKRIRQVRAERYTMLRGYYHGTSSKKIDDEGIPTTILHPIFLSADSAACGKTIKALELDHYASSIQAIRRQNRSLQTPPSDTVLEPNDTLIIQMPADQQDLLEATLLGS